MEILTPEQHGSIVYIEQDFCRGVVNVLYTEDLRRFFFDYGENQHMGHPPVLISTFFKFIAAKRRPHPIVEEEKAEALCRFSTLFIPVCPGKSIRGSLDVRSSVYDEE